MRRAGHETRIRNSRGGETWGKEITRET